MLLQVCPGVSIPFAHEAAVPQVAPVVTGYEQVPPLHVPGLLWQVGAELHAMGVEVHTPLLQISVVQGLLSVQVLDAPSATLAYVQLPVPGLHVPVPL